MKKIILTLGLATLAAVANAETKKVHGTKLAATTTTTATEQSCGETIASKAILPTKLAETMTAVADMFEAHAGYMATVKSKGASLERAAMTKLAQEHRALAKQMTKIATEMKAAANWPAVEHDMQKMMNDPKIQASMQAMQTTHAEMASLLQKEADEMKKMGEPMHKM